MRLAHVGVLMTRKSCAVGMRNAILRNYLKSLVCKSIKNAVHIKHSSALMVKGDLDTTMGIDRIRNKCVRGSPHVRCFGDKVREHRLRWFGHVQRRDSEYIGRRMLRLELPGRRPKGRLKRRFMDVVKEDMKLVGVSA